MPQSGRYVVFGACDMPQDEADVVAGRARPPQHLLVAKAVAGCQQSDLHLLQALGDKFDGVHIGGSSSAGIRFGSIEDSDVMFNVKLARVYNIYSNVDTYLRRR